MSTNHIATSSLPPASTHVTPGLGLHSGDVGEVVPVDTEEGTSVLFPGLTEAEEVAVVAAVVVAVLAVLALLMRLTMPLVRRNRAHKAGSHGHSATWSTTENVGPDSLKETEAITESTSRPCTADHPTLSRLESLNLQELYVDNWRKTSIIPPPTVHSELPEVKTKL